MSQQERTTNPQSDLLQAILDVDVDKVKALIQSGVSVDTKNTRGNPAILLAALNSSNHLIVILRDAGADIETAINVATQKSGGFLGIFDPNKKPYHSALRLLKGHLRPVKADQVGPTEVEMASLDSSSASP